MVLTLVNFAGVVRVEAGILPSADLLGLGLGATIAPPVRVDQRIERLCPSLLGKGLADSATIGLEYGSVYRFGLFLCFFHHFCSGCCLREETNTGSGSFRLCTELGRFLRATAPPLGLSDVSDDRFDDFHNLFLLVTLQLFFVLD